MKELIRELSRSTLISFDDTLCGTFKDTIGQTTSSTEAPASDLAQELVGRTIEDKYQILELLGSDAIGSIYRAHHLLLNKAIAIKLFKPQDLTEEKKSQFQRQAQALIKLWHPNIIQVSDFGLTGNGTIPFYTMELLVGQSLFDKLESAQSLSEQDALHLFVQVFTGLAAAHRDRVIHYDLKPENIFLEAPESINDHQSAKLSDFGIGALSQDYLNSEKQTTNIKVFGSPLYMSPEQSWGDGVTKESNIYSCGCALFHALTGNPPFLGADPASTLVLHQTAPLPSLREAAADCNFSPDLEKLMATMLAKDPAKRPESAEIIAAQLKSLCPPPQPPETLPPH